MTVKKIKWLAKTNDDTAIVVGDASSGPGWYALLLWPSATIVRDNITDIGRHAEIEAQELARECGLMTESEYDRAAAAQDRAEHDADVARLNSPAYIALRRDRTNALRARNGLTPLEQVV